MTNAYLVTFDTDAPINVDDRLALKDWLGQITRVCLNTDAPVAIDHLDPAEPTVQALLVVE